MPLRRLLLLLSTLVPFWSGPLQADEPAPRQSAAHLDVQIRYEIDYLLSLPKDYEKQEKWPLLLFLHGAGERGSDLERVKVHGPPKLIAAGHEFPMIVVSPQCPEEQWWNTDALLALLDSIEKTHKVDKERIYVTGLSMGGFGTWSLAARAPERFAALVPICGGGETYWAESFAHVPIWVFHGAKDKAVPLVRSEVMVEALRKKMGDPKFTVYPEAAHDSWTQTYDNPELWDWILAQKRVPKPVKAEEKKDKK